MKILLLVDIKVLKELLLLPKFSQESDHKARLLLILKSIIF
jgi:hypothetical protein